MAGKGERLELLVLSHIDNDHVEGLLELIEDDTLPVEVGEVWFNDVDRGDTLEVLGVSEARSFARAIARKGWRLNVGFADGRIALDRHQPVRRELDGGLLLTLVSPEREALNRLASREGALPPMRGRRMPSRSSDGTSGLEVLGHRTLHGRPDVSELLGHQTSEDDDVANGCSIAFVAEWRGRRMLLAADAHPRILARSMERLIVDGVPYRLDLLKVSHHGAKRNTTDALLKLIDCPAYAFSTDGSRHGHPDPETIARILTAGPSRRRELLFNYREHNASIWDDAGLEAKHDYACFFPDGERGLLTIDLIR